MFSCKGKKPVGPEDTTPPRVVNSNPNNGDNRVPVDASISLTFSEAMDQNSLTNTSFTLSPSVNGTVTYSNLIMTFQPSVLLDTFIAYTGTLSTAAKDLAGNSLASPYQLQFTTYDDTLPPRIIANSPLNNDTVGPGTIISAIFTEEMDSTTINSSSFRLTPPVSGTVSYANRGATFRPDQPLPIDVLYTTEITTSVTDVRGNQLAATYTWQFYVVADAVPPSGFISLPLDSTVVPDSASFAVIATDNDRVERVEFYIDGSLATGSADFTSPYEYSWDASQENIGSEHSIHAIVYDATGNSASTDTITVFYLWQLLFDDIDEIPVHRDIDSVFVRSTDSLLEFRYVTNGGWADYRALDSLGIDVAFFIDTDRNSNTGKSTFGTPTPIALNDIGAEYRIVVGYSGDILTTYASAGNSIDSSLVDSVSIPTDSNTFEVTVFLSRLGMPSELDLLILSNTFSKDPLIPGDPGSFKLDWAPDQGNGHVSYTVDHSYIPPSATSNSSPDLNEKPSVPLNPLHSSPFK